MTLVIVGTGTDVGKTVVAALVLARYGGEMPLAYWKPVATGGRDGRDAEAVAALAGDRVAVLGESYLFPEPLSPHLAARLAGRRIDPAALLADFDRHFAAPRGLVVETAGGILVPLVEAGAGAYLQADLLSDMARRAGRADLACLVVGHSGLGTINHTLLTLEALRARGLAVAGVVLDGPPNRENRLAIQDLGRLDALFELPPLAPLDRASLAAAAARFDPDGRLAPLLRPPPRSALPATHRTTAPAFASAPAPGAPAPAAGFPAWLEADRLHVWHPYTQMQTAPPPLAVVRAEGAYIHTADGRLLLDCISSWWVNIHGHNHPRLNRALAAQAGRLAQVIFAGLTHEPAARLAAALAARAPGPLPWVFYSDDGSTAVEVALKMAYQHWRHRGEPGRTLFVAFDDAYHGDTFGTMAAGGVAAYHAAFRDLFFAVRRARTPHSAARGSTSLPLAELLEREGERVAAVILEPMLQGAGGMLLQTPAFLREVREITRRHGIPLIADEVLTGFGRTGRLFACEHGPIAPDLLCLSKALTGGYLPLAATLASDEIYRSFLSADRSRTFFHGHSFTANALACAVALESLALFEEEDRLARVARLERLFAERLERLAAHPAVAAVRNLGGMAAFELAPPGPASGPPPAGPAAPGLAAPGASSTAAPLGSPAPTRPTPAAGYFDARGPRLARRCLDRGLLLRPLGDVVYLLPPYVIDDDAASAAFDTIAAALDGL
jgi:adenosylmethionine---8-amino-7-oxononanoate aminotransferase